MNSISAFIFILLTAGLAAAQIMDLSSMQDPGHKAYSEIAGVKFSVPNGFDLHQPAPGAHLAYMDDKRNNLGLFVAVPGKPADDAYVASFSKALAALALPAVSDLRWRFVFFNEETGASKFQTASGVAKGLSGKTYIQIDYLAVKVEGREVLIGYVTQSGHYPGSNLKEMFSAEGPGGLSMPAWYAHAHVVASVTGEKYRDINPGTQVETPVPKKESHPKVDRLLYRAKEKPGRVN